MARTKKSEEVLENIEPFTKEEAANYFGNLGLKTSYSGKEQTLFVKGTKAHKDIINLVNKGAQGFTVALG